MFCILSCRMLSAFLALHEKNEFCPMYSCTTINNLQKQPVCVNVIFNLYIGISSFCPVEQLNALLYAKYFVASNKFVDAIPHKERKHKLQLKEVNEEDMELDDEIYFSKSLLY